MDQTKHIGLRVPAPILERVDALIGQLGSDRTAVILALLRQSLAMPGTVEQQLADVQQILLDVQQRLDAVEQKQSHEKALPAPPQASAVRTYPENPPASGEGWKTMTALGKIYRFNGSNAVRDARAKGETMLGFLQRKTGLEWESSGSDRPLYRPRQPSR